METLRALANAALWTGKWYDQSCNTVACDYSGNNEFHDEIAHPCPLGLTEYLVAVQPKNMLVFIGAVDIFVARLAELNAEVAALQKDVARLDFMEKNLLREATMRFDNGSMKAVNAWSIASVGTNLRDAIDAVKGSK